MEKKVSIKVNNVKKIYKLYNSPLDILLESISLTKKTRHKDYFALNELSFEVHQGETFGIIGTNGAGKSTLLKIITGVTTASSGEVIVDGKISALLELGTGFNMEYTGMQNIYLNGMMMGYSRNEMNDKVKFILDFADIGEFIYQPVKTYSSGMFARLAFSVAINVEPEILIVDEALSVGDVFFQNKCYKKFEELRNKGTTILFVSHDIHTVKQMCSKVLWIEAGKQQMCGDSVEVCNAYTNNLLKKQGEGHTENATNDGEYKINQYNIDKYPPISYTNESIIDDKVRICSCFIRDAAGKMSNECYVGEKYILSILVESNINIDNSIVGFVLESKKGQWIINCSSMICGEKKAIKIKQGSMTQVDFSFEFPRLMRGEYIIGVAVSEGSKDDYVVRTWLYNVLALNVINGGNNSGIIDIDTNISVYSTIG